METFYQDYKQLNRYLWYIDQGRYFCLGNTIGLFVFHTILSLFWVEKGIIKRKKLTGDF